MSAQLLEVSLLGVASPPSLPVHTTTAMHDIEYLPSPLRHTATAMQHAYGSSPHPEEVTTLTSFTLFFTSIHGETQHRPSNLVGKIPMRQLGPLFTERYARMHDFRVSRSFSTHMGKLPAGVFCHVFCRIVLSGERCIKSYQYIIAYAQPAP